MKPDPTADMTRKPGEPATIDNTPAPVESDPAASATGLKSGPADPGVLDAK